jgi:hypothetical protein
MPSPQSRLDLDRVLNAVQARAAVVILVGDGGELETAARGIDNPQALFDVLWSMALQLGAELWDELRDEKRRQARLVLPTAEDARRLGIFNQGVTT